jgi:poly [ADP-ribose] polymerase
LNKLFIIFDCYWSLGVSSEFSVQVAIEMPFDIRTIQSPSHEIKIKRTAAMAMIELEKGQQLGDGFQLLVGLAEIHVPRMWVERLPNSDHRVRRV